MPVDFGLAVKVVQDIGGVIGRELKKPANDFSRAVKCIVRDFLVAGEDACKAIAGALGFSGKMVDGRRVRQVEQGSVLGSHREFSLSRGLSSALKEGILNGQGLIVSGQEQRDELNRFAAHLKEVDSFDLGGGLVVRSIEDKDEHTEDGVRYFSRSLWASLSVADDADSATYSVAVTEVEADLDSEKNSRAIFELHLARSASLDHGVDVALVPSFYSPQGSSRKQAEKFVNTIKRTVSAPDLRALDTPQAAPQTVLRRQASLPRQAPDPTFVDTVNDSDAWNLLWEDFNVPQENKASTSATSKVPESMPELTLVGKPPQKTEAFPLHEVEEKVVPWPNVPLKKKEEPLQGFVTLGTTTHIKQSGQDKQSGGGVEPPPLRKGNDAYKSTRKPKANKAPSSSKPSSTGFFTPLKDFVHRGESRNKSSKASTSATSKVPELTLVGKAPAKAKEGWAYRQPMIRDMHCGVMAANGFFQAQVIEPGDLVREILDEDSQLKKQPHSYYGGAFHSKLIDGFKQGNTKVSISRKEFDMGAHKCFASEDASFDDQWARLHNTVRGYDAKQGNVLEVDTGDWLSACGGVKPEPLVRCINRLLKSKPKDSWEGYPDEIGCLELAPELLGFGYSNFVDRLNSQTETEPKQLICFTIQGTHWFAMVKSGEQWLRLDNLTAEEKGNLSPLELETGKVMSAQGVEHGNLSEQLQAWGVTQILCDNKIADGWNTRLFAD